MVMENLHVNALQDGQVDKWFIYQAFWLNYVWYVLFICVAFNLTQVKHVRSE